MLSIGFGMLTADNYFSTLTIWLTGWSLLSMGTAVLGLFLQPREKWRAFWFMSGLWGLIDGAIAYSGMFGEPMPLSDVVRIVQINAGLDVLYLIVAAILLTRQSPLAKGFGLAIAIQGLFLLILDVTFWVIGSRLMG